MPQPTKKQKEALSRLQSIATKLEIRWDEKTGVPARIRGPLSEPRAGNPETIAQQFFQEHRDLFALKAPERELTLKRVTVDRAGNQHVRFQQTYKGITVYGNEMIVHMTKEHVVNSVNGTFTPNIDIAIDPKIYAPDAKRIALADAPGNKELRSPKGSMSDFFIVIKDGEPHLAWHVTVAGSVQALGGGARPAIWNYLVDAVSGAVLERCNSIKTQDGVAAVGSGIGQYAGAVNNLNTTGYEAVPVNCNSIADALQSAQAELDALQKQESDDLHAATSSEKAGIIADYQKEQSPVRAEIYQLQRQLARCAAQQGPGYTYRLEDRATGTSARIYTHWCGGQVASGGRNVCSSDSACTPDLPNTWGVLADGQEQDDAWTASYELAAVDCHFFTRMVFDYFLTRHGRDSYDGNGADMHIYTDAALSDGYSTTINESEWEGCEVLIGAGGTEVITDEDNKPVLLPDGTQATFACGPWSAPDIVGHEWTHAVTETTAGSCPYENQPGTIQEHISDVFGAIIKHISNPNGTWWLLGEILLNTTIAPALRNMMDPTNGGRYDGTNDHTVLYSYLVNRAQPEHINDLYKGDLDGGGVHINNGILNKAAYLMATGGDDNGITICEPLGLDKLGDVYYNAMANGQLTIDKHATLYSFFESLIGSLQDLYVTDPLYGRYVASVTNAFAAVGVTSPMQCLKRKDCQPIANELWNVQEQLRELDKTEADDLASAPKTMWPSIRASYNEDRKALKSQEQQLEHDLARCEQGR